MIGKLKSFCGETSHAVILATGGIVSIALAGYAYSGLPGAALALILQPVVLLALLVLVLLREEVKREQLLALIREQLLALIRHAISEERSSRILSSIRCHREDEPVQRSALIVAVPRSGSTWLLDAIRCHPAARMRPDAGIFEALGLRGSRYPRGLSDGPDGVMEFEIRKGRGALIPEYELPGFRGAIDRESGVDRLWIEKIHPQFFDFDEVAFLDRLRESSREESTSFSLIIHTRDPKRTIRSFLNYQHRDPDWMKHITHDKLFDYMQRSYDSLLRLARRHESLIMEYEDLSRDVVESLCSTYRWLWPSHSHSLARALAEGAGEATARDRRKNRSNRSFLNELAEAEAPNRELLNDLFEAHTEELDACYESHRTLLEMRPPNSVQSRSDTPRSRRAANPEGIIHSG